MLAGKVVMLLLLLRNQRGEHVIGGLHNMVRKSVEWVDLCNVRESMRTAPNSRKHHGFGWKAFIGVQ